MSAYFQNPRNILVSLALGEHMGDVNNVLPYLAEMLGEEKPEWNDTLNRYVFPWEDVNADMEDYS